MEKAPNAESRHVEHSIDHHSTHSHDFHDNPSNARDARLATEAEHRLTLWQAVKRYRKACFWSMAVSLTIVMDGYDTALMGSFPAFPSFRRRFGFPVPDNPTNFQLDPRWQAALGMASGVGNFVGVAFNSVVTDKIGFKKTLLGTLAYLVGIIFINFFSTRIDVFFVGNLCSAFAWGVFTTMAPAYASEVCPVVLRGNLETWVVLCWGFGQFVSFALLASYSNVDHNDWAWRIPVAVQWVWPVIIFPLICFAPESPWWLIRQGRIEDAKKSVARLEKDPSEESIKQTIALMVETNNLERAMTEGTGFLDCFRGPNLWRTEISCAIWSMQVFSGFIIGGYATYFFQQAGLKATDSFKMSVGQSGGLHFVCNVASLFITNRYGRRNITLIGVAGMCVMMFIIGCMSFGRQGTALGFGTSAVYLVWYSIYQLTLGPIAYIVVGEVSSTRLRTKTIGIARNTYNVIGIVSALISPYILNPTKGNWKGKTGFLTGGILVFCFIWTWFRLPETKGRTYEELDLLFAKNLKAREFRHHNVIELEDGKE